jgi:hypothetical protein
MSGTWHFRELTKLHYQPAKGSAAHVSVILGRADRCPLAQLWQATPEKAASLFARY